MTQLVTELNTVAQPNGENVVTSRIVILLPRSTTWCPVCWLRQSFASFGPFRHGQQAPEMTPAPQMVISSPRQQQTF